MNIMKRSKMIFKKLAANKTQFISAVLSVVFLFSLFTAKVDAKEYQLYGGLKVTLDENEWDIFVNGEEWDPATLEKHGLTADKLREEMKDQFLLTAFTNGHEKVSSKVMFYILTDDSGEAWRNYNNLNDKTLEDFWYKDYKKKFESLEIEIYKSNNNKYVHMTGLSNQSKSYTNVYITTVNGMLYVFDFSKKTPYEETELTFLKGIIDRVFIDNANLKKRFKLPWWTSKLSIGLLGVGAALAGKQEIKRKKTKNIKGDTD